MVTSSGSMHPADINTEDNSLKAAVDRNRAGNAPDISGGHRNRPTYERFIGVNEPLEDNIIKVIDERIKGIS